MAHIKFRYGLDNSRSFSVPLAKAILGLPVKKMDVIFTYEDLSSMGVVYLVPIKNNDYLIRLPYLWASAIIDNSSDKSNEKVYLNPAPVESLTFLGFNENESANIFLKRRERPFDSVDDLIEGLNIGDERLKKLKLDDRA
uniref:Uncharacterized protein n=1 Tax=Rhizophagus irregularis (strain DAOM 181602 / DAOM 197198 / MUCL 43194) TaxID=747089 RepID=U9TS51_RHIID